MKDYNLKRPDTWPITPIDERVAIYQLLLESKRGLVEDEQFFDLLRQWARHGYSFGRDNTGMIVMLEPIAETSL